MADAALVFGATGRLGKVMLQGLGDLGIAPVIATRPMLARYLATGALPPGLSLNAATGMIAGTPGDSGSFAFTVTLSDSRPESITSDTIRITISP